MENEHNCILSMAIWMRRDTVMWSWGPLSCHSSAAITSCFSMIMHGPISPGSVHKSWKLKMSQFFHGRHIHQTCHPLNMFGILGIDLNNGVFQFPPLSSNLTQELKRSGTTFYRPHQLLCEGEVSNSMRQMVVIPDTDWFSDPRSSVFI